MANLELAARMTKYHMKNRKPVFWWGAPGIGKTERVYQLGKELKRTVIDWRTNLRDPVDARGLPIPDLKKNVARWLRPSDLPFEGSDFPDDTIIFCDEMNTGSPAMQVVGMQLLQERRVGEHKLKKNVDIIAAGNRQSDRSAAQRMQRALANRLAHIDIEVDAPEWIENYAVDNCHELVVAFIRFRPALLHYELDKVPEDERFLNTPRSWDSVSDNCDAPDDLRFHLVKSLVGQDIAAEFEAFVKTYKSLPDLNEIFAKPKTAQVPDEPSALYAVSTAIGRHANRGNFDAVMTYAMRLGREYEIIVGLDATKRDPSLTKTSAYIDFTKRNKDLQIGKFRTAA